MEARLFLLKEVLTTSLVVTTATKNIAENRAILLNYRFYFAY